MITMSCTMLSWECEYHTYHTLCDNSIAYTMLYYYNTIRCMYIDNIIVSSVIMIIISSISISGSIIIISSIVVNIVSSISISGRSYH